MAVRFDASGDALTRTTNVPLRTACTITGWVNIAVDTNAFSTAFALRQSGGTTNVFLVGAIGDGTTVQGFIASTQSTTVGTFVVGSWLFVALVGNATPQGIAYARTVSATSLTASTPIATGSTTAAYLSFGDKFASGGEFLNGYLSCVKIFDAALTSTEILAESYAVQPVRQTNINSWFPFTSATTLNDQSGNARNLTNNGTLSYDNQMPPIVGILPPVLPAAMTAMLCS
jgi:hypothetical protein